MDTGTLVGLFVAQLNSDATKRMYKFDLGWMIPFLEEVVSKAGHPPEALFSLPSSVLLPAIQALDGYMANERTFRGKKNSPVSRRTRLAVLSSLMNYAIDLEIRSDNPAARAKKKVRAHLSNQHAPSLGVKEVKELVRHLDARERGLCGLMFGSGLRRNEVRTIRFSDFTDASASMVEVLGKGGKKRRVSIDAGTRQAIFAYLEENGRPYQANWPSERPVFCARGSEHPLSNGRISNIVQQACERAGIGTYGPHTLRRTFATLASESGNSLEEIRIAMGHSDPKMTARYIKREQSTVTVNIAGI